MASEREKKFFQDLSSDDDDDDMLYFPFIYEAEEEPRDVSSKYCYEELCTVLVMRCLPFVDLRSL